MNYIEIYKNDTTNGTGIRVVLWTAGCSHHCKECHNPQTWSPTAGQLFDENAEKELFTALSKPWIKGITFSGGDPLFENNLEEVLRLIHKIKKELPEKDIWLYTGFTLGYEDFIIQTGENRNGLLARMLRICDVIVDGPYIEDQRNITLAFMGSENQRLIDVKDTLKQGHIVQYKIN